MLGNQTFEVLQTLSKLSHQSLKVFEFVDMFWLNNHGQNFQLGIPLSKDFRYEVIQIGAIRLIQVLRSEMCEKYCVNRSNVWLPSMFYLRPIRASLLRSCSGRSHAMLPVPTLGAGEHCVTPARAAAKETKLEHAFSVTRLRLDENNGTCISGLRYKCK